MPPCTLALEPPVMDTILATPDRRSILIDAYENAAVIVTGRGPDQLRNSTPCPDFWGWTVSPRASMATNFSMFAARVSGRRTASTR